MTNNENGQPSLERAVGPAQNNVVVGRTLVGAGIAIVSAALTFFAVRNAMRPAPMDETSERIQSLIDEANRLLRKLDEKKHG